MAVAVLAVGCSSSAAPLPASPTTAPIAASATAGSVTSTFMPTLETATASSVTTGTAPAFMPTLQPATASSAAPTASSVAPTGTAPAATTAAPSGTTLPGTPHPAVTAILAYLQARARTDIAAAADLSCKAWKPQAVTEAISFRSMSARLVGVVCDVTGSAGGFTLVGCRGKIVTTYGGESRDWDQSAFVYQVTTEDGQWKMCGYH